MEDLGEPHIGTSLWPGDHAISTMIPAALADVNPSSAASLDGLAEDMYLEVVHGLRAS